MRRSSKDSDAAGGGRKYVLRAMTLCGVAPGTPAHADLMALAGSADVGEVSKRFLKRMRKRSPGTPGTEEFARVRQQNLLHLARRMVRHKKPLHARFLLSLDPRADLERDQLLAVRLDLAALEGDRQTETAVMREIWALPEPSHELLAAYEQHNNALGLSTPLELFEKRWGPRPPSVMAGLDGLCERGSAPPLNIDRVKWVWSISDSGVGDYDEFLRRAHWGHLASDFLRDLVSVARSLRSDAAAGRPCSPHALHWANAMLSEIDALLPPFPLSEIEDLMSDGSSVIACISHTGLPMALEFIARQKQVPFFRIGLQSAVPEMTRRPDSLDPRAPQGSQLLNLARSARARPMGIGISPDGQFGDRHAEFPFLGRRVLIGQGAPSLAYLARARTIYLGANWKDGNIEITFRIGPSAGNGVGRGSFFDAWNAFYLGCLREVLLGAPENLRFAGGIWRTMRPERAAGAE